MIDKTMQLPVVKRFLNDPWYIPQATGVVIALALRIARYTELSHVVLFYSVVSICFRLGIQTFDNKKQTLLCKSIEIMNKKIPTPKITRKAALVAALILSQLFPPIALLLAGFSGVLTVLTHEMHHLADQHRLTAIGANRSN